MFIKIIYNLLNFHFSQLLKRIHFCFQNFWKSLKIIVKTNSFLFSELLEIVENCPEECETLVSRIIHVLTEKVIWKNLKVFYFIKIKSYVFYCYFYQFWEKRLIEQGDFVSVFRYVFYLYFIGFERKDLKSKKSFCYEV